jgi:prepilin peptidase CpaA
MPTNWELPLVVALFTLLAAAIDWRSKRVPNYLTVPAAIAALAFHAFLPHGQGALFALAGFAVGFVLLLAPWLLGGGGMGDVKLLAALGAWLGPVMILVAFAGSAIVAAVLAAAVIVNNTLHNGIIASKRKYLAVGHRGTGAIDAQTALNQAKKRRVLPFAIPVAISTWLLLAWMLLSSIH